MFFFTIAWTVALGGLALWALARSLRHPTPESRRYAGVASAVALAAVLVAWWWLTR